MSLEVTNPAAELIGTAEKQPMERGGDSMRQRFGMLVDAGAEATVPRPAAAGEQVGHGGAANHDVIRIRLSVFGEPNLPLAGKTCPNLKRRCRNLGKERASFTLDRPDCKGASNTTAFITEFPFLPQLRVGPRVRVFIECHASNDWSGPTKHSQDDLDLSVDGRLNCRCDVSMPFC